MIARAGLLVALALCLQLGAGCAQLGKRPAPQSSPAPEQPQPQPQPRSSSMPTALSPEAAADAVQARMAALADRGNPAIDAGSLGYYLDVLQARLQQLASQQLQVSREGESIRLRLPSGAGFESGRAALSPAGESIIDALAKVLREFEASFIAVHGHTDDSGSADVNRRLSGQRAQAVVARLRQAGVEPARLMAVGHGSTKPLVGNDTEAGRERNRRVELELLPIVR